MGDEVAGKSPSQGHPVRLALANLALLATMFAFVTVAIRALVVARLDVTTALALVQATGPVNVFVGTLTAELPSFLSLAVVVAGFSRSRGSAGGHARNRNFHWVLVGVGLIFVVAAPWVWSLSLAIVGLELWVIDRIPDDAGLKRSGAQLMVATVAALAAGMFLLSSSVWLPQEALHIEGEDILGYVLEEEGRWVSVLEEAGRELRLVEEAAIDSRKPCASPGELGEGPSIAQLVMDLVGEAPDRPSYPLCK